MKYDCGLRTLINTEAAIYVIGTPISTEFGEAISVREQRELKIGPGS